MSLDICAWVPAFDPTEWDPIHTYNVEQNIIHMLQIAAEDYDTNPDGHVDDPTTWSPKNVLFRINYPDRLSAKTVKIMQGLDEEIGLYL